MVKAFIFILLSSGCAVASNVLLRKVLENRGLASSSLVETFWNFVELFREPMIWLVCLVFGAAVALWILALSSIRLSVAYPVQTALVFVLTGLASYVFFHEAISLKMAFGYLLIIGGITLVSV